MAEEGKLGDPGEGNKGQASENVSFEIDGKTHQLTSEEAKTLFQEKATVTQQGQKNAVIIQAADKYGITPEQYVEQAEGGFTRLQGLVTEGILNEEGEINQSVLKGKEVIPPTPARISVGGAVPDWASPEVQEERLSKAVAKALGPLTDRIGHMEEDQARTNRTEVETRIITKHPGLDTEDIARLFVRTRNDRNKTIWGHAEEMAKEKADKVTAIQQAYAKKMGIDVEAFEERNKLKDQEPGIRSAGIVGKLKLSFKKGKDKLTPRAALEEDMRQQEILRQ